MSHSKFVGTNNISNSSTDEGVIKTKPLPKPKKFTFDVKEYYITTGQTYTQNWNHFPPAAIKILNSASLKAKLVEIEASNQKDKEESKKVTPLFKL